MNDFDFQFVVTNGVRFHVATPAQQKDGPLVVLLHGFPEFWYSWRHQMPALAAAGFHVAAPDQRGYNESAKPAAGYDTATLASDVAGLIKGLGYERAHIVGHDWGGAVAWHFAARYPEMTDRLVIMNAPHMNAYARALRRNPVQLLKSWYVFLFQIPWLPEQLLCFDRGAGVKWMLRRSSLPGTFNAEDLERYASAFCKPGVARAAVNWYRMALRGMLKQEPVPNRGRIAAPTLLIWGVKDVALDLSLTIGLERWVTDLAVRLIPDASHWVQQDRPELVNRYLVDFLTQTMPDNGQGR